MDWLPFTVLAFISLYSVISANSLNTEQDEESPKVKRESTFQDSSSRTEISKFTGEGRSFGTDKDPEKHEKLLVTILNYIDKKLDEIFQPISKRKGHGEDCTFEIDIPLNVTNSTTTVSKWLTDLEDFRNLVADDLFADQDELRLIWTLVISLRNSAEFIKETAQEITICDPTRLLVCSNDSRCVCQTDDLLYSPLNKLSSTYDPQLGACVLYQGIDCPAAPTSIFCETGSVCLTEVGLRPCTIENLREDLVAESYSPKFLGGFSLELNQSSKASKTRTFKTDMDQNEMRYRGNTSRVKSRGRDESEVKGRVKRAPTNERYTMSSKITQNYHCTCYGAYEGGGTTGNSDPLGTSDRFEVLALLPLVVNVYSLHLI